MELENVGLFDDLHVIWPLAAFAALEAGLPVHEDVLAVARRAREEAGAESVLLGYAQVIEALAGLPAGPPTRARMTSSRGSPGSSSAARGCGPPRPVSTSAAGSPPRGGDEEAGVHLESAAETYRALGATRWLERVQALPAATGSATVPPTVKTMRRPLIRRSFAAAAATTMLLGLAACGGDDSDTASDEPSVSESESTDEEDEPPTRPPTARWSTRTSSSTT